MKKVKITLTERAEVRTFPLFRDPDDACVWLWESNGDPKFPVVGYNAEIVELLPGEFIEAEWYGCEYNYEGETHYKINSVRLAKAREPRNAAGLLVRAYSGWTTDCVLPFGAYADDDIEVSPLTEEDQRVNMASLFKDDDQQEGEKK